MLFKLFGFLKEAGAGIFFGGVFCFMGYYLYIDVSANRLQDEKIKEQYGQDYYKSWHSHLEREPESLDNVKGLEGCVYIIIEKSKNDTRHAIRCQNTASLTVPGKFPQITDTVK